MIHTLPCLPKLQVRMKQVVEVKIWYNSVDIGKKVGTQLYVVSNM